MHQSSEFQTASPDMPPAVRNILEKLGLHSLATVAKIRETLSEPLSAVQLTDQEKDDLVNYYGVSPAELGFFESHAEAATDPDIAESLARELAQMEKKIRQRIREKKMLEDPLAAARKEDVVAGLRAMNQDGNIGKDRSQRLIDALNELNRQ